MEKQLMAGEVVKARDGEPPRGRLGPLERCSRYVAGTSGVISEKPADWDKIAFANGEAITTRLRGSGSRTRTED